MEYEKIECTEVQKSTKEFERVAAIFTDPKKKSTL